MWKKIMTDPNMRANIIKEILKTPEKYFIQQFNQSIIFASQRTIEYIGFKDPESNLKINNSMLTNIFLMTYIDRSIQCKLTESIICTKMTEEQAILLGIDWVWAVQDASSKNPKVQIAVQVIHMENKENQLMEKRFQLTESMKLARQESINKTHPEKISDFCSSIGKDCYGLFLFFGRKDDPKSILGILSNDFHTHLGYGQAVDDAFLLDCIEKAKTFVTPGRMLELILQNGGMPESLQPICVKFTQ
ncbi:rab15 effector protein [Scyliorhinus canicula]|uniref:rab15 effector protein n=1 Tax=Scyliorhinus canicula TaxID=7830 RepID=UPI0018F5E9BB|nr:rab15 effector protein [Scyliorhinus canicula]XP_038663844.1 rab15 effector protein [Scyliorhinus canicula]XP_038663845.1 rab15 effector protein [Scyliorhinus canicula]